MLHKSELMLRSPKRGFRFLEVTPQGLLRALSGGLEQDLLQHECLPADETATPGESPSEGGQDHPIASLDRTASDRLVKGNRNSR